MSCPAATKGLKPRLDRWRWKADRHSIDPRTGYLTVDGTASMVGVLEYGLADGAPEEPWYEFVPLSTLQDQSFLDGMHNLPLTLGHPPVMLDADNTRTYQIGSVTKAWMDGESLRVRMQFTDAGAIRVIRDGMDELSLGYHAHTDERPGKFRGQSFHESQDGRIPNHLAALPLARAGHGASIDKIDGARFFPRVDGLRVAKKKDQAMDEVEIEIGGVKYTVPQPVADALTAANEKLREREGDDKSNDGTGEGDDPPPPPPTDSDSKDEPTTDGRGELTLDAVNTAMDAKLEAFGDKLVGKLDEHRKRTDAAAQARGELVAAAQPFLPQSYKTDGVPDSKLLFDAIVGADADLKPAATACKSDAVRLRGLFDGALAKSHKSVKSPKVDKFDSDERNPIAAAKARQRARVDEASQTTHVIGMDAARERRAAASGKGGK